MTKQARKPEGHVEPFPGSPAPKELSRHLGQLRDLLLAEFPRAKAISFAFDGALHVHIDVKDGQDVQLVARRLETIAGGIFGKIWHGASPHHPFAHRISATVDC